MHNTLAASDYGLLEETTFHPRPSYWGALLWHRLMGKTVLDASAAAAPGLHVYAHCHASVAGAVTVLAINISRSALRLITLPLASERYTLKAAQLQSATVRLNGSTLALDRNDELPRLIGSPATAGVIRLAPATITFLVIPKAANPACG
jgi:hypothetical protein